MGVTFSRPEKGDFSETLNARVNEFFKSQGRSKNANAEMVTKTIFMFSLYLIPYTLILLQPSASIWFVLGMYMIMGLGAAGLGLSVMHDAVHGSYSKSKPVNTVLGWTMYFIGGSALNWKVQHNVLHHTYPNIDGFDDDIKSKFIVRMSPSAKLMKVHKYQFIYAWILYSLASLNWVLTKDFRQLLQYNKAGLIEKQGYTLTQAMVMLILWKLTYLFLLLALPMILTAYPIWFVVVGFLLMHMICGTLLSLVFQPAHVSDQVTFYEDPGDNRLTINFAEHQLYTTLNFANSSRWFTWFVGGLNFQIEHHLFPHICHVHYRPISKIVKQTAAEFDLPYSAESSFFGALGSHARMLKRLGTEVA